MALFKLYKDLHHLHNPKIHFHCEIFDKIILPICDYTAVRYGDFTKPLLWKDSSVNCDHPSGSAHH